MSGLSLVPWYYFIAWFTSSHVHYVYGVQCFCMFAHGSYAYQNKCVLQLLRTERECALNCQPPKLRL